MPLPTERMVTGKFVNPVTGEPYSGENGENYVIFEPVPARWTDRTGHQILLGGGKVNLDTEGSFAEDVVCTDAPGVLPDGRLWRLRQFVGGAWAENLLVVPQGDGFLDITDYLSVPIGGVEYLPVPGPPGPPGQPGAPGAPGEPTVVQGVAPVQTGEPSPGTVTVSLAPGQNGQVLTTTNGQVVWGAGGGSGSDAVWGSVLGTLADQLDLKAALDTKVSSSLQGSPLGLATLNSSGQLAFAQIPDIPAARIASGLLDPARLPDLSDTYVASVRVGAAGGVAALGPDGKVPSDQVSVTGGLQYRGSWNAATNTPALADGTGANGDLYKVAVAGQQDLGSGTVDFQTGDHVVYVAGADRWERFVASESVASVAGKTGVVTLDSADVGLGGVDNTSDADKPVSGPAQAALDAKADTSALTAHTSASTNVHGIADTGQLETVTGAQDRIGAAIGAEVQRADGAYDPAGSAAAAQDAAAADAAGQVSAAISSEVTRADGAYDPAGSADGKLARASNLADLPSPSAARTSLGLSTVATSGVGTTAGTVAAGDDARITGALQRTGGTVTGHLAVTGHALGQDTPAVHGVAAWAYDPALAVNSTQPNSGTVYLTRVDIAADVSVTRLYWWIGNEAFGAVAGQNAVGLYSPAGTLLAAVNVDATVTTAALKITDIPAQALTAGSFCWVAMLFNATGTPGLTRGTGWTGVGLAANLGLAPAEYRFAMNGSGLTALPASLNLAANVGTDFAGPWAAVGA